MTGRVLQRQIVLAGAALVAAVAALAIAGVTRGDDDPPRRGDDGGEWTTALAAPYTLATDAGQTACGHEADPRLRGVAHPVLPCGAKVTLEYAGVQVLTQVVDRGAELPGREFDVTRPLANELGLTGVRQIRWRFAQ